MGQGYAQGASRPQFGQHPHHLGDDLAGLAHHDRVAGMQIQLGEAVGVVEGGAAHRGAGQGHGLEFSHRCYGAGAAHLAAEPQQAAGGFLGGVLEGDGPARRFLGEASGVLEAEVVELHHHAIGGVGKGLAGLLPAGEEGLHRRQVGQALRIGIHPEAGGFQPAQAFPLAAGGRRIAAFSPDQSAIDTAPVRPSHAAAGPFAPASGAVEPIGPLRQMQGVGEEVEPPGRHHLRIELAQGAGAGVAGVGEGGLAAGDPFGVDRREGGIGDQGLAPHLHPGRRIGQLQAQGHALDRAHVGGDLLAPLAVAPGGGPHQHAVRVAQGQGIAIDLQLPHHRQRRQRFPRRRGAIQNLEQAAIPGLQLLQGEGVVEAEQADPVLHVAEALGRLPPHPLGRTVGAEQLGEAALQLQQFAVEPVVDRVFHHGRIEHVVGVGGSLEQLTQFGGPLAFGVAGPPVQGRQGGRIGRRWAGQLRWRFGWCWGRHCGWCWGRCFAAAHCLGGDRDHLACRALHAGVLTPQSTEQAFTQPLTLPQDPNGPAPPFPA